MIKLYFGHGFGELCAWIETKLWKLRPREFISPKRKLQNLVPGSGSRFSLRRLRAVLSDRFSRSGKEGSPKRGRDETCTC